MLEHFRKPGKASFVLGGQWGSEGKGAACAFVATHMAERGFDIVTANNGSQSGHTSTHDGVTKVLFHLPTASAYPVGFQPLTYLNGGAVIDPVLLLKELEENPHVAQNLAIHPNAAIITPDCKDAEMRDDSPQTKIASTRKGVGEALSRKVLRSGFLAKDLVSPVHWYGPEVHTLKKYVRRIDLNEHMLRGSSVLVEIPQGHSLSIDGPFYPHTTSRNCTVGQAMADAGIHPHFYHQSMLVIRTFPIRVGAVSVRHGMVHDKDGSREINTVYGSGGHFPDQHEIEWADLGVAAEITTVTKRVRRVFTFSEMQVAEALASTRPGVIYLTFCDYVPSRDLVKLMVGRIKCMARKIGSIRHDGPEILTQWGPTTADVIRAEDL